MFGSLRYIQIIVIYLAYVYIFLGEAGNYRVNKLKLNLTLESYLYFHDNLCCILFKIENNFFKSRINVIKNV